MASTNSPSQAKPINKREVTAATLKDGQRKTAKNTFKTLRHQHIDERRGIITEEFYETFNQRFEELLEYNRENPGKALREAYYDYVMDFGYSSNWETNWSLHWAKKEMFEEEYLAYENDKIVETNKIVEYLFSCIVCEGIIDSGDFCNKCAKEFD